MQRFHDGQGRSRESVTADYLIGVNPLRYMHTVTQQMLDRMRGDERRAVTAYLQASFHWRHVKEDRHGMPHREKYERISNG